MRLILLCATIFLITSFVHADDPPPLALCTQAEIDSAMAETGQYTPSAMQEFVRAENGKFMLADAVYPVRGVNYYPSAYPWRRFLTETDEDTLRHELALMQETGFNTLRIFLWHEALFLCPGSGAVPNPAGFGRLDMMMHIAAEYGFRLIVTLNDMPDLTHYPLYDNPPHSQQQMMFIVSRYRDEAAVLAWDVRNEGDIDYGTHFAFPAKFSQGKVLEWLRIVVSWVRTLDENHLVTAGWLYDAESTAPYVDFVSFHHWQDVPALVDRIDSIRASTEKPILLQEVGYSTQRVTPDEQALNIGAIMAFTESENLAGWLIWTAFDFPIDRSCYPSPCLSPDNAEHYFGIWRTDYTPKPAVEIIKAR